MLVFVVGVDHWKIVVLDVIEEKLLWYVVMCFDGVKIVVDEINCVDVCWCMFMYVYDGKYDR